MKLSWGFLLPSLYFSAAAAASQAGHVFIWDPAAEAAPSQTPSVSPETARLILAKRLGLSRFHSIKSANEHIIGQLNTYGGPRQKLFGGDKSQNQAHALIWIDGADNVDEVVSDRKLFSGEFHISNPPDASANQRLLNDIALQAEAMPKKADHQQHIYLAGLQVDEALRHIKDTNTFNEYLTMFHAEKDGRIPNSLSKLLQTIKERPDGGFPITVVLMPSTMKNKRSADSYGSWYTSTKIEARREKGEMLLAPAASQSAAAAQNSSPLAEDVTPFADTDAPLGILKTCYASQSACERVTHNCTGHGSCVLLHKGQGGEDAVVTDCYGCTCKATVEKVKEGGKKTTNWGGPACQKKDVSVPFWLFVASGVAMAFLITFGIGMLYSIGSEELPSVIGAGVSGPVRK